MSENKDSVSAVVVTYNRKHLLLECLEALRKQTRPIQAIYLIDNASTDDTPEILLEKGYIKELPPKELKEPYEKEFEINNLNDGQPIKLHYVRMHENTGGAGGFYEGVKRGYEKGYDWLWLMDDDAEPKKDAFEKLVSYFNEKDVSALASLKVDIRGKILHPHRGYFNFDNVFNGIVKHFSEETLRIKNCIEIDHASFVGIIVSRLAIKKIGFPKKEFFIHYDDVEYCIKLRKFGKILLIRDSVIIHKEAAKEGADEKFFLFSQFKRIPYDKLWLTYYSTRNLVWLGKKYSNNMFIFYLSLIRSLLRLLLGIILFDDHKFNRAKFYINSYFDGLKGNFDNQKPKRILYSDKKG